MTEKDRLITVLNGLGVHSNQLGCQCLIELVEGYIKDKDRFDLKTHYFCLCLKFHKSSCQIERSIKFLIYQMNQKRTELYESLFECKPEIMDLIKQVASVIEW